MIDLLILAAEAAPQVGGIDLNLLLGGGGGATLAVVGSYVFRLILDRTVPSRSDSRASQSLVLESLSNMVKVLQEEKVADATRLESKQDRIDALEEASTKDYDLISELRTEITDLRNRLALKDRHIRILVLELRRLGAQVTGLDADAPVDDIEVTMNPNDIQALRTGPEVTPPTP